MDKLGKSFEVDTVKGKLLYNFINKSTLFYNGEFPAIEYFRNKGTNINLLEYNKIEDNECIDGIWSVKNAILEYLKKDLICLTEVMY